MATGIPLPGNMIDTLMKGLDTGSTLYSRAVQPIIEREKQKQLEQHFQEQLKLSKAAAARNASLMPYRLQELQDKHAAAQFERNMMNQLMGGESGGGDMSGGMGGAMGGGSMPAPEMPTEEAGQGQGMFTPEGLAQAQQALSAPQGGAPQSGAQAGGANSPLLHKLMQNPMMRGWFKHKFGYDPLAPTAQTPEDKQAMALDLFKQKEGIKQANKVGSGETLTAPIKTKYQNVIGGVTSARPILEKLIAETKKGNIPGQLVGSLFKRDAQANYKGEVSTLLDGVRNAYTIPNTDSGTAKAEDKVLRKSGESDANYAKRLQSILKQMDAREKDARVKLSAGNITASAPDDEFAHMSDDELRKIAGGG